MEIRKVPISLLNAAPYNPRKDLQPGDLEYQKIARSIEKYGCVEPIILCLTCLNRTQPPSWTFSRTWALRTVWRMRHDTVCDMRTSDGGLSLLAGG